MKIKTNEYLESKLPEVGEIFSQVRQCVDLENLDSFWNASTVLDNLDFKAAIADTVECLLNDYLDGTAEQKNKVGEPLPFKRHLILANADDMTLSVSIRMPSEVPHNSVITSSRHMLFKVLQGELTTDIYRPNQDFDNDVFDDKISFEGPITQTFKENEYLKLHANTDACIINPSNKVILLSLISPPVGRFDWSIKKSDKKPLYTAFGNVEDSILVNVLDLSAAVCGEQHNDALTRFLAHPNHQVRWAAYKAIFCTQGDDAISYLSKAENDQHVLVRKAASQVRSNLEGVV